MTNTIDIPRRMGGGQKDLAPDMIVSPTVKVGEF